MPGGACTAPRRGHDANSQRGRDCPASVHGPAGAAPAGAATAPSSPAAAQTAGGQNTASPKKSLSRKQQKTLVKLGDQLLDYATTRQPELARKAALDLMDAVATDGTKVRRAELCALFNEHVLCELFEDLAVALASFTGSVTKLVEEMVDRINVPPLLSVVLKVVLKRAAKIGIGPLTKPIEILRLKACFLAIAFCPNTDTHRGGLEKNCAIPVADYLSTLAPVTT